MPRAATASDADTSPLLATNSRTDKPRSSVPEGASPRFDTDASPYPLVPLSGMITPISRIVSTALFSRNTTRASGKDYRNYQREGIGGHASPKRCGERDSDPSLFSCVVSGDQYLYLSRGRIFQHGKPLLGSFQAHRVVRSSSPSTSSLPLPISDCAYSANITGTGQK